MGSSLLTRRRFLRLTIGSAAPALIPQLPGGSTRQATRVVIVGAGLAGLRAADLLVKAGCEVIVLEARPHAGGRVVTIRSPFDDGLLGEAGAIRIASAHKRVLQLTREHRLTLVPFESPNGAAIVSVGGSTVRSDQLDRVSLPLDLRPDEKGLSPASLLARYVGALPGDVAEPSASSASTWAAYDRQTWPDWLRARGASPGAIRLMTLGGDSSELSALYVLRQMALLGRSSRFFKIRGGMDQLPRALATSLGGAVHYRVEVVRLERTSRMLRVGYVENGSPKQIEADHVILAIPFSTLKQVDVRPKFSPEKTRAIVELPYFASTRFLLQSKDRFWQESGLSGAARTDRPAELWDAAYEVPATRGLLGATVGGLFGQTLATKSAEECVRIGKEVAADAFPKMALNFEKGVAYRWALEQWSRGGFAVFRPGQMTTILPEAARPEGRVHFAGEHTSPWTGWMEGALESAERAAREVLNRRL